jgi:hypothetical protein
MNIFVTDPSPTVSAQSLPDKHIVKMPLESCQMLAIVCSEKWGHGYGKLHKKDGTPYFTDKGAFRNHPCTVWANESNINAWWLVAHAMALCEEYTHRYGKVHSCQTAMNEAEKVFEERTGKTLLCHKEATPFAFAGPDVFKFDTSIDTLTAYKRYIASKPWVASNYLRDPSKKPNWL